MQTFYYDAEDAPLVASRRWHITSDGYVRSTCHTKGERSLHRLIMNAPPGTEVDHIDRNPLNNRRANLRMATRQDQGFNRGLFVSNTSGYTGVSFHCGRFQASIRVNGKLEYLGRFDTPKQAYEAYLARKSEVTTL